MEALVCEGTDQFPRGWHEEPVQLGLVSNDEFIAPQRLVLHRAPLAPRQATSFALLGEALSLGMSGYLASPIQRPTRTDQPIQPTPADLEQPRGRSVGQPAVEAAPVFKGRLTGPAQVTKQLARRWGLQLNQVATLLDLQSARHAADILNGVTTLSGRDRHDRVRNLFLIHETLSQLFRDPTVESEWLREPRSGLRDKNPLELMLTGSMEELISVRRYVEYLAGR